MSDSERKHDETIPGGRYIDVNGHWINAKGQYIDRDGTVVEEPIEAEPKRRAKKAPEPPST